MAFACVISFMGIGLVDPILPSLSSKLHATPSQVELLFTSYLVVTAIAMLVTGWVSSRLGASARPWLVSERRDAEAAVEQVPALPSEAILAAQALAEDAQFDADGDSHLGVDARSSVTQ